MSASVWQRITTIGLDLGDRFSKWCGIDDAGQIVAEERLSTTTPAMAKLFSVVGRKRVAIETGTHSPWVSRLLESLGHEVIVANSRNVQLISKNRQKDDRHDARTLARLERFDVGGRSSIPQLQGIASCIRGKSRAAGEPLHPVEPDEGCVSCYRRRSCS
jgi:transposase